MTKKNVRKHVKSLYERSLILTYFYEQYDF